MNTPPSNSDRKMPLSFLSPELSQATAFLSAALKGTSSSPSLGRKWWEERQRLRGLAFLCTERYLKLAEVTMTTHLSDNKSQKAPLQQATIFCVWGGTREELWGPQKFRDYGVLLSWQVYCESCAILLLMLGPCHCHSSKVAQQRSQEMYFP